MKDLMSIDLSPQELLSLHISISSHALLNQSYSNLLLSQQLLTSLSMDPGLTVKIKAYQNQLRQQAHTFKQSTMSELIGLFTKASNFSTLVTTVDGIFSTEDPQSSQKGGEMVAALATVAQSYQVAAQAVHTQFSATRETLEPLMNNFSETVSAIEQGLGAEAKQQAQTITALNEAIAKIFKASWMLVSRQVPGWYSWARPLSPPYRWAPLATNRKTRHPPNPNLPVTKPNI